MLVTKLRIFALLMRLQELDQGAQGMIVVRNRPTTTMMIKPYYPDPPIVTHDKKGKPFDPPKSKYHK
jgi:hypothetical protein